MTKEKIIKIAKILLAILLVVFMIFQIITIRNLKQQVNDINTKLYIEDSTNNIVEPIEIFEFPIFEETQLKVTYEKGKITSDKFILMNDLIIVPEEKLTNISYTQDVIHFTYENADYTIFKYKNLNTEDKILEYQFDDSNILIVNIENNETLIIIETINSKKDSNKESDEENIDVKLSILNQIHKVNNNLTISINDIFEFDAENIKEFNDDVFILSNDIILSSDSIKYNNSLYKSYKNIKTESGLEFINKDSITYDEYLTFISNDSNTLIRITAKSKDDLEMFKPIAIEKDNVEDSLTN